MDLRKLRDYVLNTTHQRGRHKARVFAATFGLTTSDAEALQELLLEAAQDRDVELSEEIEFGTLYKMDFPLLWNDKTAEVRVTWIVRNGEDFPRLVSCFIKRR